MPPRTMTLDSTADTTRAAVASVRDRIATFKLATNNARDNTASSTDGSVANTTDLKGTDASIVVLDPEQRREESHTTDAGTDTLDLPWAVLSVSDRFSSPVEPGAPGPLGIPHPKTVSAVAVRAAAKAWDHPHQGRGWGDEDGLITAWLLFALRHAHQHPPLKVCFLRIISRVGNSETVLLEKLHVECDMLGAIVAPKLERYFEANRLGSALEEIKLSIEESEATASIDPNPALQRVEPLPQGGKGWSSQFGPGDTDDSDTDDSDSEMWSNFSPASTRIARLKHPILGQSRTRPASGRRFGAEFQPQMHRSKFRSDCRPAKKEAEPPRAGKSQPTPLHQGAVIPVFDPLLRTKVKDVDMYGNSHFYSILAIMGRFVDPRFHAACEASLLSPGDDAELRRVPVKTVSRMFTKNDEHMDVEYAHYLTKGALNLDPVRIGVLSTDAHGELEVWRRLRKAFKVLRVKNLFLPDAELSESKLRFILVNVLLETDVTYAEWVASPTFEENVRNALVDNTSERTQQSESNQESIKHGAKILRELVKLPEVGSAKIAMVCEIQLHLKRYVEVRKLTHLWFKVRRAEAIYNLKYDCEQYKDAL